MAAFAIITAISVLLPSVVQCLRWCVWVHSTHISAFKERGKR